jgi:hypothetical protein
MLSVRACHDKMEDQYGSLSDLILFYIGGLSTSTRRGGTYLIRSVWFPSRLPLEGTGRIQFFWIIVDDPWYPGYKTVIRPHLHTTTKKMHVTEPPQK